MVGALKHFEEHLLYKRVCNRIGTELRSMGQKLKQQLLIFRVKLGLFTNLLYGNIILFIDKTYRLYQKYQHFYSAFSQGSS